MTHEQLFVKMALDSWKSYLDRTDELFKKFTDEEMMMEIAPGRNRNIYLLGHLTAVHDRMLPLFGLGERLHPELDKPFLTEADKSVTEIPSVKDLRSYWSEVNQRVNAAFEKVTPGEWFEKHASVSAEDFSKEPHRNKLNVLINRTNHLAYHYGQVKLAERK